MFPINIFKCNKGQSRIKLPTIPIGYDPYQFEILSEKSFYSIIEKIQFHTERMLVDYKVEDTFCFYCGTRTKNIIPAFLHDKSGINLWMYTDWRCSYIICEECCNHAGKVQINYQKKVLEIKGAGRKRPKKVLEFEPDILLPTLEPSFLHFNYKINGYLEGVSKRAANTINKFSLNRPELVNRRLRFISEFKDSMYKDISDLSLNIKNKENFFDTFFLTFENEVEFENSRNFISYAKLFMNLNPLYYHATEILQLTKTFKRDNRLFGMYEKEYAIDLPSISKISINGLRNFSHYQEIEFDGKNNLVIIGENGVGKSTLLEIFKIGLNSKRRTSLRDLIDKNEEFINYEIEYSNTDTYAHTLNKEYQKIYKEGHKMPYNLVEVSEYRISKRNIRDFEKLLQEQKNNTSLIDWTIRQLKILLDLPQDYLLHLSNENVYWYQNSSQNDRFYFEYFSSGYTSLITIFYKILKSIVQKGNVDREYDINFSKLASTIVLIDEIELHLHPKFKKEIIGVLKKVFPEVLFIMTTHDPLILKSAKNSKIAVLNKREEKTFIEKDIPSHEDLTTEQILTSPIFGLSTISDNNEDFKIYYDALNNKDWSIVEKQIEKLSSSGFFGKTYRELVALSTIDIFLARKEVPNREKLEEILEKLDSKYEKN